MRLVESKETHCYTIASDQQLNIHRFSPSFSRLRTKDKSLDGQIYVITKLSLSYVRRYTSLSVRM